MLAPPRITDGASPAVNGRSEGLRPIGLRPKEEGSHKLTAFPHTVRLASTPPDLPFTAGLQ